MRVDLHSFAAGFLADFADVPRLLWIVELGADVEYVTLTDAAIASTWMASPVFALMHDCAPPWLRRGYLYVSGAIMLETAIVLSTSSDLWRVTVASVFLEMTFVWWSACIDAWRIADAAVDKNSQTRGTALYSAGSFLGYSLGGAATHAVSIRGAVAIYVAMCAACAVATAASSPTTPRRFAVPLTTTTTTLRAPPAKFADELRGTDFVTTFVLGCIPAIQMPMTLFLARACSFSPSTIGLLGATNCLVTSAASMIVQFAPERSGRVVVECALYASIASYAVLALLVDRWSVVAGVPDILLAMFLPLSTCALASAQALLSRQLAATIKSKKYAAFTFAAAMSASAVSKAASVALVVWASRATGVANGDFTNLGSIVATCIVMSAAATIMFFAHTS